MRARFLHGLLGVMLCTGASAMVGCSHYYEEYYLSLIGTGTGASDGGTDGGDSGPPPSCIPSGNDAGVADMCGVFVSSVKGSDTTGQGTQDLPYATITMALTRGSTIYVCAGTAAYYEANGLSIDTPVTLFGALDCGTWAYDAANKTKLTAPADTVPLTLSSSASGSAIYDFAITAVDAMTAGDSSIAVWDNGADLTLDNVDVTAGNGAPGAAGMPQNQVTTPAGAAGGVGADNTCGATSNGGGNPGQNMCLYMSSMVDTSGGIGGTGTNGTTGGDGTSGNPMGMTNNGGSGQTASASCNPGTKGTDGSPGMAGSGATGLGTVDTSGYHGPAASAGLTEGSPGQGGGGGGGADKCSGGGSGPAGGGGGAGGCGGGRGNPGQSGGSSFGILALNANLTFTTVKITAKAGGAGGVGGDGQQGAPGGGPGHATASSNACDGGKGGQGGRGGSGGGGTGGHSAGIAVKGGMLPDLSTTTITYAAVAAVGGIGGNMDTTVQGDSGKMCKALDFMTPTSPTACAM